VGFAGVAGVARVTRHLNVRKGLRVGGGGLGRAQSRHLIGRRPR
jgi:hypothetical protein